MELRKSDFHDGKPDKKENKSKDESLEDRIIELTTQLKKSEDEIECLYYSISHDLRAPLRAIDGYSNILEKDYGGILDEEGLRVLHIVRSSTKCLDGQINGILVLSRVGRCSLKLTQINMKALVNSVIEALITTDEIRKITFVVNDLPDIESDRDLLRQVWVNLISNSIKFSLPKEKPEILLTGNSEANKVTYTIKDNGVGFNPKFKSKLFELFQHLHNTDEFEGSGVGLTIVQRIIHRLGGEIWGDGHPDIGTEFSFTLPGQKLSEKL